MKRIQRDDQKVPLDFFVFGRRQKSMERPDRDAPAQNAYVRQSDTGACNRQQPSRFRADLTEEKHYPFGITEESFHAPEPDGEYPRADGEYFEVSADRAAVTITVEPENGYGLDQLTVTDKDGKRIF